MARILIIDDDEMLCDMLQRYIAYCGHEAAYRTTLTEGMKAAASQPYDLIFLDVNLPDGNGLESLPLFRKLPSMPEIIIITGQGDPDGAELAIKTGAWDYIGKPLSLERISLPLIRALEYRKEKSARKAPVLLKKDGIIGSSPQIEACLATVAQIATSDANVLITGETGTGKELFARAVHQNSSRAEKKFVIVDCTAIPETLAESILFGHEKGAFTGADRPQTGLFQEADGGTLFLDEIGELSMSIQKVFLRILQERSFRPVGSTKEFQSNFRLIAATNRDLEKMVSAGEFRQDLFFRVKVLTLELPPLRERPQDIRDLTMHYIMKFCERYSVGSVEYSSEFMDMMTAYNWPGNIRELVHTIERILTVARFDPNGLRDISRYLPNHIRAYAARDSMKKESDSRSDDPAAKATASPANIFPTLEQVRESAISKAEKQYFKELMTVTGGNIKESCRLSGLSRSRLYHFLQKYRISRTV